jgi:hypothetical protein
VLLKQGIPRSDTGFVIGNGTSRRGFDLSRLDGNGITVGCNYIFRDYEPNYIVAIDEPVVEEIKKLLDKPHRWKFITRAYLGRGFWWLCADDKQIVRFAHINHRLNQNSGILAAYFLACTMQVETLYLLGVDFFRQIPGQDNDVYSANCAFQPRIHVGWNRLIEDHPDTRFVRVGPIHERDRDYYDNNLVGMEFIDYEELPI